MLITALDVHLVIVFVLCVSCCTRRSRPAVPREAHGVDIRGREAPRRAVEVSTTTSGGVEVALETDARSPPTLTG